jgi:hypothetical protein
VLWALCTGILIIFAFVSLRLIVLCSLFFLFLSHCFPTFCGKASRSNFFSLLSFLVKTEVFLQSVPPLPISKHLQTPQIYSVLSPVFWNYCRTFPNITNLQTWEEKNRFQLFSTYFRRGVCMFLWVGVHYEFSGIQRFGAEWDVHNNRHTFSGDEREKSLRLHPDSAVLCAVERIHSCYREVP